MFKYHLSRFFGNQKLKEITTADIDYYKQKRVEEGAASGTVNRELALLRHILNHAVAHGFLASVPKFVMLEENPDEAWHIITDEEFARIIEALHPSRRPLFWFLWYTGVRLSNALNLRWEQVNLAQGTVRIPSSATKHKKELVLPLLQPCLDMLKKLRERTPLNQELVFVSEAGTPLNMRNVERSWKRALKKGRAYGHHTCP